jgi:hypothetical protein
MPSLIQILCNIPRAQKDTLGCEDSTKVKHCANHVTVFHASILCHCILFLGSVLKRWQMHIQFQIFCCGIVYEGCVELSILWAFLGIELADLQLNIVRIMEGDIVFSYHDGIYKSSSFFNVPDLGLRADHLFDA